MKIVINGREYSRPDELPPDARDQYERAMSALADKNGNGIPDILEVHLDAAQLRAAIGGAASGTTVITTEKFVVSGRHYNSVEEMPAADRQHFETIRSLASSANMPAVSKPFDPLNPAELAPSRGLFATNPIAVIFVVMVLTALVTCAVLALVGALR